VAGIVLATVAGGTVVSAATGLAVAALAVYVKRRAANLATKHDFKVVLDQTSKTTEAVEQIRADIARGERARELEIAYQALQRPVLDEAVRLIIRLYELFRGLDLGDFADEWTKDALSPTNPGANKRDATLYSFARLWGGYAIYRAGAASLPPHRANNIFRFYLDVKIGAALGSRIFPGRPVLWRDSLVELGELSARYSEDWKSMRPVTWFEFTALANSDRSTGDFFREKLRELSDLLRLRSDRALLLCVFLIDLVQDTTGVRDWERMRNSVLNRIGQRGDFYLYGRTATGQTDLAVMRIPDGVVPRNPESPLFDTSRNDIGYTLETRRLP
jgi:hypothetical protein